MQGGQKAVVLPDNANVVAVAPPVDRFAYLPISVPSAAAAALRRAAAPALLPAAAGASSPCTPGTISHFQALPDLSNSMPPIFAAAAALRSVVPGPMLRL